MGRLHTTLLTRLALALAVTTSVLTTSAGTAQAGNGGRFTFLRDDGSYWGVTFAGAGYGEIPFAIDTNGDGRQELAVYYNGRMTIRRDDGSYWGFNFQGGGSGEVPLAVNLRGHGDRRQQFAVYYNGRFTWLNDNGSYSGATIPGANKIDQPLAVDTDGDGVQELGVYRAGRFTFMRADGSLWGVTFSGATATELPFVIDTNGDGRQELAVYRDNRVTIRRDDGSYWGFNFQGAGRDELPLAIDTDGNGRQEFTMYNHVSTQLLAKQLLAHPSVIQGFWTVTEDLNQTADGQPAYNGYSISSVILRAVLHLSYNHTVKVTAFTDNGMYHSSGSLHYFGDGVDFGAVDGVSLTGRNPASHTAINITKEDLVSGSRFGQVNCPGNAASLPNWIYQISDTCNHLHIDVPRGTN